MQTTQHEKLDELIENASYTMYQMIDSAVLSGALTDEFKEDNYLLAKAIITIWGDQHNYEALDEGHRQAVKNLSHVI